MSVAFTNTSGATWQTLLNEITLAYSERRQVLGQSAYTPAASRNVQSAAYWQGLQWWIQNNCATYVDYVNGPVNVAGDNFLLFSSKTFRAAAGLHADGFRRVTGWDGISTPIYSYGYMQDGDIIGPWVFEDLQRAFSAMRWTTYFPEKCMDYYFPEGHPHRAYKPYPEPYPDNYPHKDNPWIFNKLNGIVMPVDVWVYPFNKADDFCTVNGVMQQADRYTQDFQSTPRLLFGLNMSNNITIEVFDTQGVHMGFQHKPWLARWNFTNCNEVT